MIDVLEKLNPVSSLMIGMFAASVADPSDSPSISSIRESIPSTADWADGSSQFIAPRSNPTAFAPKRSAPKLVVETVAIKPTDPTTSRVTIDSSGVTSSHSSDAIAGLSVPQPRSSPTLHEFTSAQPRTSGGNVTLPRGGAGSAPDTTSAASDVNPSVPAADANLNPGVSSGPTTMLPDGVRAMTQAPRVASQGAGRASGMANPPPASLKEFDSGGAVGAPPILNETDVINGILPQTYPNYAYDSNGVPIGASIGFLAVSPSPDLTISSVSWQGGTNYSGYLGIADVNNDFSNGKPPAPSSMTIGTPVSTITNPYSFLIDSNARTYSIQASVQYVDGNGVAVPGGPFVSTVTFTSWAPKGSLSVMTSGSPKFYPSDVGDTVANVQLDNKPTAPPGDYGMRIKATMATSDHFGGSFIFMQIIIPQRSLSAVDGGSLTLTQNGVRCIDAPTGCYAYPLDRSIFTKGKESYIYGISLNPSSGSTWFSMGDSPNLTATLSNTPLSLQVGSGTPEKFETYLMYGNNIEGVWVAIARLDWQWSKGATRPDGMTPWITTSGSGPSPTAGAVPPIGPAWDAIFNPLGFKSA